jgi:hypothetical protein
MDGAAVERGSNFELEAPSRLVFGLGGCLGADGDLFLPQISRGKAGLGEFEEVVGSAGQGPLRLHSFEATAEELA